MSDQIISPDLRGAAARRTRWRMLGKFVGILAALLAYTFLRGIEGAKHSYDEEHGRPIVLVGDQYAVENAARAANDTAKDAAFALGSSGCLPLYPEKGTQTPVQTPTPVQKKRPDAILLRVCALQGFFDKSEVHSSALKNTLEKKLMYQNFTDAKGIVDRLDDEILADAEFQKKAFLATEDAESRARASKLPDLSQDIYAVDAALTKTYFHSQVREEASPEDRKKEFEGWVATESTKLLKGEPFARPDQIQNWRSKVTQGKLAKNPSLEEERNLLLWRQAISDQRNNKLRLEVVKNEVDNIDEDALAQINLVYVKLKPKLGDLIEASPGALKKDNAVLAFLSPRAVLDESSGAYVIYRTFRLAAVMVLVFGVIFVILLALRPLPFFSRGTDQLWGHAGELFKHSEGVVPQLAKSLAVTAAALGVGAAVVVAGSSAIGTSSRSGDNGYPEGSEQREVAPGREGKTRSRGAGGQTGSAGQSGAPGQPGSAGQPGAGGIDVHVVKLEEPILYPTPITVSVPQIKVSGPNSVALDPNSLLELTTAIKASKPAVTTAPDWNLRMTEIANNAATEKLKTLDIVGLNKRTEEVTKQVAILETWRIAFGSRFDTNLEALKNDVSAAKTAVEDLRDNSRERLQNSGGRSLITRTQQVLNRDRYFMTTQSLTALRSLMHKRPHDCPKTSGAPDQQKKCCDSTPTDATYCPDAGVDIILTKLTEMIGHPPMSESDFMKELRTVRDVSGKSVDKLIDQWKSIILKYTRMAY